MEQNELMHYGVLGMKYQKLQAKADKLSYKAEKAKATKFKRANPLIRTSVSDARYQKAARLSDKAEAKYVKAQTKANKYKSKYEKGQIKAGSAEAKYLKAQKKAEKWRNAMDETSKDYNVNNLPSDKIDSGKEFVKKVA